jgi:tetratricopeptide (TPR) repeat protein
MRTSQKRSLVAGKLACIAMCWTLTASACAQATSHYEAVQSAAANYRAGDAAAATKILRDYLAQSPDDSSARVELARYLAFSKRYPEAMAQYQDVLRRDPQNMVAILGIAKIHSWEGDFPAALELYERILARSPQFYDARVGKAFTLLWMGEKEPAAEIFRWAARVHPYDAEVRQALAELGIAMKTAEPPPAAAAEGVPKAVRKQPRISPVRTPPDAPVSSFPEPVAPAMALAPDRFPPAATALVVSIAFVMCGALVFLWRNHSAIAPSRSNPAPPVFAQAPLTHTASKRPKVLIADSNSSALEFQRTVFASSGFEVVSAATTQASLAALRHHHFDHIVLDAQMHEAVAFIRQNLPTLAQRMLLTAATNEQAQRVKQRTGLRCITRPLRMTELIASASPYASAE